MDKTTHHRIVCSLDQIPTNSSIDKQEMMANASEIIHMPPQYQRFKSLLDLPHAATAIIRHSPSTTRTLGMSCMIPY